VPGYEAVTWGGIVGPAGMPKEIVERLNVEINKAIAASTFRKSNGAIGNEPLGGNARRVRALHSAGERQVGQGRQDHRRKDGLTCSDAPMRRELKPNACNAI
jgi:hypothetical protein